MTVSIRTTNLSLFTDVICIKYDNLSSPSYHLSFVNGFGSDCFVVINIGIDAADSYVFISSLSSSLIEKIAAILIITGILWDGIINGKYSMISYSSFINTLYLISPKEDEAVIQLIPFSVPLSLIPIEIKIITVSVFKDKRYFSDPLSLRIGPIPIFEEKTEETPEQKMEEKWDEKLLYFMQITSINADDFHIELKSDSVAAKHRKFRIKEIALNEKECVMNKKIIIPKKKYSGKANIDIDESQNGLYQLALCDMNNTNDPIPKSNQIKFIILKDKNKRPPSNKQYKPNPIELSSLIKVKDEENDKINIYWSIPPQSFGAISYKIINNNDDEKDETIQLLPYHINTASVPTSFKVITIATIEEVQYESNPSNIITVGIQTNIPSPAEVTLKQKSTTKEWSEFPNLLQILSADGDIISIKFALKESVLKRTKVTVKSIGDNIDEISENMFISQNKQIVIKDDIMTENDKTYKCAVFRNNEQISNTVIFQTPSSESMEETESYIPLPPLKNSVTLFYDKNKENILVLWDCPKSIFGDKIIYKIQISNKKECDEILELPYKIPLFSLTAPIKLNITTISIINNESYHSIPSDTIDIDIDYDYKQNEPILKRAKFDLSTSNQMRSGTAVQMNNDQYISIDDMQPNTIRIEENEYFPNLLQFLGITNNTAKIKFCLKQQTLEDIEYKLQSTQNDSDEKMNEQLLIGENKNSVYKEIVIQQNKTYQIAAFLNGKRKSNIITFQTPSQTFKPNMNYKPIPPSIQSVKQYFDKEKENILIVWDFPPKLTFGDSFIFEVKSSNKSKCEQITELPYKLKATSSLKIQITIISIINNKLYRSIPSETIYIDLPNAAIPSSNVLPVQYLNDANKPMFYILIDDITNKSFVEFRNMLFNQLGVNIKKSYINSFVITSLTKDNVSDEISENNFNNFKKTDLVTIGIILSVYFRPKTAPKLKKQNVDTEYDAVTFLYEMQVPFILEYEIYTKSTLSKLSKSSSMKPDKTGQTDGVSSQIIISNVSELKEEFKIRAKYVLSNIYQYQSDWSTFSPFIHPPYVMVENEQRMLYNYIMFIF